MEIFQPRINEVSSYTVERAGLRASRNCFQGHMILLYVAYSDDFLTGNSCSNKQRLFAHSKPKFFTIMQMHFKN